MLLSICDGWEASHRKEISFEIFGDGCHHDAVNVRKAIAESNKKWEKPDIQKLIKETKDHRET